MHATCHLLGKQFSFGGTRTFHPSPSRLEKKKKQFIEYALNFTSIQATFNVATAALKRDSKYQSVYVKRIRDTKYIIYKYDVHYL